MKDALLGRARQFCWWWVIQYWRAEIIRRHVWSFCVWRPAVALGEFLAALDYCPNCFVRMYGVVVKVTMMLS